MILKQVILSNFRSYGQETRIDISDSLTAFIGKNDVGKSSVLDALDAFFNAKKLDPLDACVYGSGNAVRIGCVFGDISDDLVLDATCPTTLLDEHLLNAEGDLEIHMVFNCGIQQPTAKVHAVASYPTVSGGDDLPQLPRDVLRRRLEELGVDAGAVNRNANPLMRQAIWSHLGDLQLVTREVPLDESEAKKVWEKLQKFLPTFAVFRADRQSQDGDSEVQDPMKAAVKEAIAAVQSQLSDIEQAVQARARAVADETLRKLQEMDPELATQLSPEFREKPKWDSIFKLTLNADDQIPMNKRGSGARRLLLLSFFRAAAERRQREVGAPSIIYAIEEPETSQHPDNQIMLVGALDDLSQQDGCQVIVTTHVPGLAAGLPLDAIKYVRRTELGAVEVSGGADVYEVIAEEIGVVPDSRVKVILCVEGPNDLAFLKHMSAILREENPSVPDLTTEKRIACITLGGQTLEQWVSHRYLGDLRQPQVHIYDSEEKYRSSCEAMNSQGRGCWAVQTTKLEMENYLHPDAVEEVFGVHVEIADDTDVPVEVARLVHAASESEVEWSGLDPELQKKKESQAKRRLNNEVASRMTRDRINQRDPNGEIMSWFVRIAGML